MFLPNSPFGDAGEGNAQNENFGTAHYWNVWHSKEPGSDGDWVNYRKSSCRFSSEFGFAAPAGPAAWRTVMAPSDWDVNSDVSKWHDKTRKGYETYLGFINRHFPEPTTFDDFIYYGQTNQALALQCGIEHWRSLRGRCMGTLFWQLNDCWATHSWAVIDSAGVPKLAYYQVKRSYAPRIVSIVKTGNRVTAHVVNDLTERIDANIELSIRTFDGQLIVADRKALRVDGDSALRDAAGVTLPGFIADSPEEVYAEARITADNKIIAYTTTLLAEPKNLRTGQVKLNVSLDASGNVIIRTERFAPFVMIRAKDDAIRLTLSDNGFHVSPGEVKIVSVKGVPMENILDAITVTAFER
jgi:beta-mannosidase